MYGLLPIRKEATKKSLLRYEYILSFAKLSNSRPTKIFNINNTPNHDCRIFGKLKKN